MHLSVALSPLKTLKSANFPEIAAKSTCLIKINIGHMHRQTQKKMQMKDYHNIFLIYKFYICRRMWPHQNSPLKTHFLAISTMFYQ